MMAAGMRMLCPRSGLPPALASQPTARRRPAARRLAKHAMLASCDAASSFSATCRALGRSTNMAMVMWSSCAHFPVMRPGSDPAPLDRNGDDHLKLHNLSRAALTHLGDDTVSLPQFIARSMHTNLRSM